VKNVLIGNKLVQFGKTKYINESSPLFLQAGEIWSTTLKVPRDLCPAEVKSRVLFETRWGKYRNNRYKRLQVCNGP